MKMNTKLMTIGRLMTSLVLAMILCFSMAMPAFAADDDYAKGENGKSAEAAITKILRIADGTAAPAETFEFVFEAKTLNGVSGLSMPTIGPVGIEFKGGESGSAEEDGVVYLALESDNILEDVADTDWPHAGVYVYEVTETDNGTDGMTYSKAKYQITFFVENVGETSSLFVAGIGVKILSKDDSNQTSNINDKVDPTPGGDEETYFYSQVIFTNTYVEPTEEKDPTDPDNYKLDISKTVAGAYGDRTMYFDFEITIDRPATLTDEVSYKAYIVEMIEGELTVVTDKANYEGTIIPSAGTGTYAHFLVTTGSTVQFKLKHGQQLVFTAIHDGASYIAEEAAVEDYTASAAIVVDGAEKVTKSNQKTNEALSTALDEENEMNLIGKNQSSADFTNTYKTVTPTGISVDNLPFIMLLVISILGVAVYVTFKYRRSAKNEK